MSRYSKEFIFHFWTTVECHISRRIRIFNLVLSLDIFSLVLISIQCQRVCLFVCWFFICLSLLLDLPFFRHKPFSQLAIHTCRSHFGSVSVFSLFVCIVVVSQSIRHTVHKFIRQIVKPSICLSIFLFVFAILLVCLLAIHLVCKILVTLYW